MVAALDSDSDQGADTLSQILLGRDTSSPWFDKPSQWAGRTADPYENITKHLLKSQTPDGNWIAGGQSGNPSELPTAWAILALASRDEFMNERFPTRETIAPIARLVGPNDKAMPVARDRALSWLCEEDQTRTFHLTEAIVTRFLVTQKLGKPAEAENVLRTILTKQNKDGGWSADTALNRPSDAYATGQTLYALNYAGSRREVRMARERAVTFLLKTQRQDGSWFVPTKAFSPTADNPSREKRTDEVYSYWGTAWATLGLLQTLPVSDVTAKK